MSGSGTAVEPAKMARGLNAMPMRRPARSAGTIGQRISVEANFFKLSAPQLSVIYQYSVEIQALRDPDSSSRSGRRDSRASSSEAANRILTDIAPTAFVEFNRSVFAGFCRGTVPRIKLAYDGRKMAYSKVELPPSVLENPWPIVTDRDGVAKSGDENTKGNEKVFVEVTHATTVSIKDILNTNLVPDTILAGAGLAAIDAVLAARPLQTHVQVGRSFYHSDGSDSLGGGAAAWRGFYQSARLSQRGLLVNMDESRTPFWEGGGLRLADFIRQLNNGRDIRPGDTRGNAAIAKMLVGLKVKAEHNNIKYRVHGFSREGANQTTFFDEKTGRNVSISEYMRTVYNTDLEHGNLPCVITNPHKKTMIPLELLTVARRQRLSKAMSPDQTKKMIRCAATKPHIRKQGALNAVYRVKHNSDETCRAFGISVESKLMTVDARILPPPQIEYRNRVELPKFGVWDPQHKNQMLRGAPMVHWIVLDLCRTRENELLPFIRQLVKKASEMGLNANPNPKIHHGSDRTVDSDIENIYRNLDGVRIHNFPLQLILIVMRREDTATYNMIKIAGDIKCGVASQVMLSKHLTPQNPRNMETYCGNLILKINAKLGGLNNRPRPYDGRRVPNVPFLGQKHILLGADVTHPSGGRNRPSVAALVGSRDPDGCLVTGAIRNMPPRQELMTYMGEMFAEVYARWIRGQGAQPQHAQSIIMFRDGVSEGQFSQVMEHELHQIRVTCAKINPNFNPKITYIVVTKRHHARFFPSTRDAERSGNIPPGTVVDTGVVSAEYYDFYVNTHAGIQGTSRPSKYTVLIDENNISIDALQAYIYRLSHNYARCNRSVSIVNVAYYAHLLAFRGRAYLYGDDNDTDSIHSLNEANMPETAKLDDRLARRMFFV